MEGQSSETSQTRTNVNINNLVQSKKSKFSTPILSKIKSFIRAILGKNHKEYFLTSLNELVDQCARRSFISREEQKMISNIINIDDVTVSDVTIPRTDIVAMSKDSTLEQIKDMIIDKEHTRIPIYGDNLDDIIGFIHSKDLVKFLSQKHETFDLKSLIRKIIYVPHSMKIVDLLRKMRFSRVHIAIVLDEYGGVDGLVTIEDIMEEIVGEIEDEHDFPDNDVYHTIQKINDNTFHVGGRVETHKVESLLSQKILGDNNQDFETIGGFILSQMKKVPQIGEILSIDSAISFKILEADLRSIKLIEINKDDV